MTKLIIVFCLLLTCAGCADEQAQPVSTPESSADPPGHARSSSPTDTGAQLPPREYLGQYARVYTHATGLRTTGTPPPPVFATLVDGRVVYEGQVHSIAEDGTLELHSVPPLKRVKIQPALIRRIERVDEGGYERGKAAARADLQAGRPRYFLIGQPRSADSQLADILKEDYGLTLVDLGCTPVPPMREQAKGYNEVVFGVLSRQFGDDFINQAWEKDRELRAKAPKDDGANGELNARR